MPLPVNYIAGQAFAAADINNTNTAINLINTGGTLVGDTFTGYTETLQALGTIGSGTTVLSLATGTVLTGILTASTASTFTMPTATAGQSFIFLLKQAASTGNGTATFTGVKWAAVGTPTMTATAAKMDIFTFVSDGASWFGSYIQGFTP